MKMTTIGVLLIMPLSKSAIRSAKPPATKTLPLAWFSNWPAQRCNKPVAARPRPKIINPISANKAVLAKPDNRRDGPKRLPPPASTTGTN